MSKQSVMWVAVSAVALLMIPGAGVAQAQPTGQETERKITEKTTVIREREEVIIERKRQGNPVKVAIFVKNRVGQIPDDRIPGFEDLVAARLASDGFLVISREDVLNSVATFGNAGANKGAADLSGARADELLSNNTSASRLAQNLGADFLLTVTMSGLDTESSETNIDGRTLKTANTTLSTTYRLLYSGDGTGFKGGVIETKKNFTVTNANTLPKANLDAMLREAAKELAAVTKKDAVERMPAPQVAAVANIFQVVVRPANYEIPEVYRDLNTKEVVIGEKIRPQLLNVNVDVDGITVGTSPGDLPVVPGLHKMRLSREGFKDWVGTVNLRPGQVLNIDMEMTVENEQRMLERAAFFEKMKTNKALTDGTVSVLEGYAQFLRQSGIRVDVKKDVKVTDSTDTQRSTSYTVEKNEKVKYDQKVEPATRP